MRHVWWSLDYDARTSANQARRSLHVCVNCGMEKDFAARSVSWVVGYRLHRGKRRAQTATYLPTPPCPGRLPTQEQREGWNTWVDMENIKAPNQAQSYDFGDDYGG